MLDILRRHIVLPIEVDKGQNVSNDRNKAIDVIQEDIKLDKMTNLIRVRYFSHAEWPNRLCTLSASHFLITEPHSASAI